MSADAPIDLVEMANSIADTIGKVTKPLTDEQRTFLAAALGPWIDRARYATPTERPGFVKCRSCKRLVDTAKAWRCMNCGQAVSPPSGNIV